MRIGSPRSFASAATSLMCSRLADVAGVEAQRLHAGLDRGERERYWKWMSATIGTGERGTIWARPSAASSSLQVQRTMSQPAAARA